MPISGTLWAKSFGEFDSGTGGPIRIGFTHAGTPVKDRVADQQYPTDVTVVDKDLEVEVEVRDISVAKAREIGASGAAKSAVLAGKANITVNFGTLKLYHVGGSQNRATPGNVVLRYCHESADGSTNPLT